MKIQNSSIFMASTHHETSFTYKESMTMQAAKSKDAVGAILSLSQEAGGKSVKEAMVDYQKQEKEAAKQKQKENENRSLQEMAERMRTEQTGSSFEVSVKTDPLMINLDANIGSVSDQKFFFDLDSDGKEEQISFAGKGSGFLALDKNGDGKINDGSELFGTSSGDGFKDLAEYDEDKNGWIDENDSIFSKLKVWTKDEESCGSRDLKGDTNDTSFKLKQRGTEENYNGK